MIIAERQVRLRELLAERGMSDLDSLAGALHVSQSTVRRDVDALVDLGLVKRTHGGVIWIGDRGNPPNTRPYAFDQRMEYQVDAKRLIARAARQLVQAGETILLDGGTTTYYFAEELDDADIHVQIVTNSLPIANHFINSDNVELVLTGGLLYPRYGVLLGPTAEQNIASIHAKTMFFSVAGVHDALLYNPNLLLVQAEQRMMEQAQRKVLLVDSGKFGQQALARLCPLKLCDVVVSDGGLSREHQEQVRAAGCELIIADS